jgi:gliding motility-associated-like protein
MSIRAFFFDPEFLTAFLLLYLKMSPCLSPLPVIFLLSLLLLGTLPTQAQVIVTVAGTGAAGFSGDGGAATSATLNVPTSIVFDKSGNMLIADQQNAVIRKLNVTTGVISTIAGTGSQYHSGDGGPANMAELYGPTGLAIDNTGNIFIAEEYGSTIRKIDANTGIITTIAGVPGAGFDYTGDGGPATQATFWQPTDVALDVSGNVYIADWENNVVRKITTALGIINTAVGYYPGFSGYSGDGGPATGAELNECSRIFLDPAGNLLIGDQTNNVIRKVDAATNIIRTIIGSGANGYAGDGGPANKALLNQPSGVIMDANGVIYVADSYNNVIRMVNPSTGIISTVAGNGIQGYSGDGGPALNASFYRPVDLALDAGGSLYIADARNNVIRKITFCSSVAPTVSITQSPGTLCTSNPVFTAVPANGGSSPTYQWQINGVNIGTNSSTYTGSNLAPGSTITCIITTNAPCATPATAISNSITVSPLSTPAISIAASATEICSGAQVSFSATPVNGGSAPIYNWSVNGIGVGTNNADYNSNALVNGDVVSCTLASSATCLTTTTANSNTISIIVHSSHSPSISVEATATTICAGDPVSFTATIGNSVDNPVYQWQVNGLVVGGNTADYESGQFSNGDIVLCQVTGNNGCAVGRSATVIMTVNPLPKIIPTPDISLLAGQSITLNPKVSGDINSYAWSPGTRLSDSTIQDPMASPVKTTLYTLTVKTTGGCSANATIKVIVYDKLSIPNAFTPNGDGRNDIFYVLGGPPGSSIKDLSVYNRWGEKVFQMHNGLPADPAFGWNGMHNGAPVPPGAYVYSLLMRFADGTQQQLQGTVILVR